MCRRCSECEHYSHHWMYAPSSDEDNNADHECKHCNALGDTCGECMGDGCATSQRNDDRIGDPDPCPECDGEGVVLVAGGDVVYERRCK